MLDQDFTRTREEVGAVDAKSGALWLYSRLAGFTLLFISRHVTAVSLSALYMRMRRILNSSEAQSRLS